MAANRRGAGQIKNDLLTMLRTFLHGFQDFGGLADRTCTLCDFTGRFRPFGRPHRLDALCPECGSLERHRLLALYARSHQLFADRSVLHFAPEPCLTSFVKDQNPSQYLTSSFGDPSTLNLNIESIDLGNGSFDVVIASHVLEHVNDRLALRELRRILKSEGTLILMIPIVEGWKTTYENSEITNHDERKLHFGQKDHVRIYGADFRERLAEAGFEWTEFTATEPHVSMNGLLRGEKIFLASATPPDPCGTL